MLDNRYALLFIRGERPIMDLKYDILRHPNVSLTADGGAEPYRHGEDLLSIASVTLGPAGGEEETAADLKRDYLIFTEEEMEEMIRMKTKAHEREDEK